MNRPNLEPQDIPAERPAPCSTTDRQTEGWDHLSTLGLVAAQQASLLRAISATQHPAMRAHSATQRPSTSRSLSVVVSRTMVKTLGPIASRSLAVAMVDKHYHGPGRTLSMTVRTVADSPPSNYGPSRAQSTDLGSKVPVSASLVSAPVPVPVDPPNPNPSHRPFPCPILSKDLGTDTQAAGRTLSAALVSAVVGTP